MGGNPTVSWDPVFTWSSLMNVPQYLHWEAMADPCSSGMCVLAACKSDLVLNCFKFSSNDQKMAKVHRNVSWLVRTFLQGTHKSCSSHSPCWETRQCNQRIRQSKQQIPGLLRSLPMITIYLFKKKKSHCFSFIYCYMSYIIAAINVLSLQIKASSSSN